MSYQPNLWRRWRGDVAGERCRLKSGHFIEVKEPRSGNRWQEFSRSGKEAGQHIGQGQTVSKGTGVQAEAIGPEGVRGNRGDIGPSVRLVRSVWDQRKKDRAYGLW